MNDYMLLDLLRGKTDGSDHELVREFKKYMQTRYNMPRKSSRYRDYDYEEDWEEDYDYPKAKKAMYEKSSEEHFDSQEAKQIVSEMYHYEASRRHMGEHFDMRRAEDVYKRYKNDFVSKATPEDVYVAINATYHDFCSLYKSWFGANIDERIILTAITFWFKDDDAQGNKIFKYFE